MSKYNFNIDIVDDNIKLSKGINKQMSQKNAYTYYQSVDLDLPSGNLWHMYNIGIDVDQLNNNANAWVGKYYAWGEVNDKSMYNEDTYEHAKNLYDDSNILGSYILSKYNRKDHIKTLLLEDDIAHITLGNNWHIPSYMDYEELLEYTRSKWVDKYNGIKHLCGRVFTSKVNKKSIFFPVVGYMHNNEVCCNRYNGYYWTNDLAGYNDNWHKLQIASFFHVGGKDDNLKAYTDNWDVYDGFSVRAISNKKRF